MRSPDAPKRCGGRRWIWHPEADDHIRLACPGCPDCQPERKEGDARDPRGKLGGSTPHVTEGGGGSDVAATPDTPQERCICPSDVCQPDGLCLTCGKPLEVVPASTLAAQAERERDEAEQGYKRAVERVKEWADEAKGIQARSERLEEALREEPERWSFDTLILVARRLLAEVYPENVFPDVPPEDEAAGDPGPQLVRAVRRALAALGASDPEQGASPFRHPGVMSGYPLDADEQKAVDRVVDREQDDG